MQDHAGSHEVRAGVLIETNYQNSGGFSVESETRCFGNTDPRGLLLACWHAADRLQAFLPLLPHGGRRVSRPGGRSVSERLKRPTAKGRVSELHPKRSRDCTTAGLVHRVRILYPHSILSPFANHQFISTCTNVQACEHPPSLIPNTVAAATSFRCLPATS